VTQAGGFAVRVELGDPALLADELKRLEKVLKTLEKDLAMAAKKLDNPDFLARAKEEVVEAEREKHARLTGEERDVREREARLRKLLGSGA